MVYIDSRLDVFIRGALIDRGPEIIKALQLFYFLEVVKLSNFITLFLLSLFQIIKSIALSRHNIKNIYFKLRSK
jgi:hypothetical protein